MPSPLDECHTGVRILLQQHTEVWTDKESHDQSLTLPEVRAAIAMGRPLIAGFGQMITTAVAGGLGLA
jgi:quinol monooxygenase YgiN